MSAMEDTPKERRHLSHHALIDSAIRSSKQLASSSDIMTRSLANRMFAELTQLRRDLPNRRSTETISGTLPATAPGTRANRSNINDIKVDLSTLHEISHPANSQPVKPAIVSASAIAQAATVSTAWDDFSAIRDMFDSGEVEWQEVVDLHRTHTRQRLKKQTTVLCLYGGLEFDADNKPPVTTAPSTQPRLTINPIYTITPQQEPLGLIDAWIDTGMLHADSDDSANAIRGYEQVTETAKKSPGSRLVFIAEHRFELATFMQRAQALNTPADWLISVPADSPLHADASIWERASTGTELGELDFALLAAPGAIQCEIRLRLWAQRVEIQAGDDKIWVTCLLAREIDAEPKSGVVPMESRLLTNRSVQDLPGAKELMEWWQAFGRLNDVTRHLQRVLEVDYKELADIARIAPSLAVQLIITCRIAQLYWHAAINPELDANLFFTLDEIRGTDLLMKRRPDTDTPISLTNMLQEIAKLGGAGNREENSDAKFEATRLGMHRLSDAVAVLQRMT